MSDPKSPAKSVTLLQLLSALEGPAKDAVLSEVGALIRHERERVLAEVEDVVLNAEDFGYTGEGLLTRLIDKLRSET